MTPRPSLSERIMRRLPESIAVNPERVMINAGCTLIGLSSLINSHNLLQAWGTYPRYEWGAAMLIGGLSALYGMFRHQRSPERLGMLLILVSSLVFAFFIPSLVGLHGVATGFIFFFIAVAKAIRLVVSAAVRAQITRTGGQMGEDPRPGGDP